MMMAMCRCIARLALIALTLALCTGCPFTNLIGGALQNEEYQKLVDTPPKYHGLEGQTVAVIVNTDMSTLYEFPSITLEIAGGVAARIGRDVPGTKVLHPQHVIDWQYRTPQWNALPYGEMIEQLNVDRVVYIDVLEYRLNPPGNRWQWEGVATGRVGIVERGGLDPDAFSETFDLTAKYPNISGLGRESASQDRIDFGLKYTFVEHCAWLFHQHLEPKYPDKYRPELESPPKKKT